MEQDLGFHRTLVRTVRRHLGAYPAATRAGLVALLVLWQVANAAGFLREGLGSRVRT